MVYLDYVNRMIMPRIMMTVKAAFKIIRYIIHIRYAKTKLKPIDI